MNTKIDKHDKTEIVYLNPGIREICIALNKISTGLRVSVVMDKPLNRESEFHTTFSLPLSFLKLQESILKTRSWQRLFFIAPHLFQPLKVIYSGSLFKKKALLADKLLKHKFGQKSISIKQKKAKELFFLQSDAIHGTVFQEYKIDLSRLFIELLKYFQQKGGTVIFSSGTCNTEDSAIIQSKKQRLKKFLIDIDTPTHFAMVFYGGKSIFRMTELENKLLIEPLSKSAIALSKAQSISQLTNCILFDKDKVEEVYLSANLSAATLKILSKAITETLPCSFENANLDDMYEICLEKYDIAKQTGITYPGFKKLFHKYGKGIDEMTELAYDFMNKVRDPRQIWDLAENMYQKKYEWKN